MWESNLEVLAPLLRHAYVLDLDPTEKTVYGFQEGAEHGYNPQKKGHRGQCYHTLGVAELRLVLGGVVLPGSRTAGRESLPMLEKFLGRLPAGCWPRVVRGDVGFGTEATMSLCGGKGIPFIFKVKRSLQVKRAFDAMCDDGGGWTDAGEGWKGCFAELRLQGWSRSRRLLFLCRPALADRARGEAAAPPLPSPQPLLDGFELQLSAPGPRWDWMAIATDTGAGVPEAAQLYRDGAACENTFDEMKNQFGWSGFTSRSMLQTAVMAGLVALVANLWNIFTRLADGEAHREAATSRPLLQHVVGRLVRHAGQAGAVFNCFGNARVKRIYSDIVLILNKICTAAQSDPETRWMMILYCAFRKYQLVRTLFPPQIGAQMMLAM